MTEQQETRLKKLGFEILGGDNPNGEWCYARKRVIAQSLPEDAMIEIITTTCIVNDLTDDDLIQANAQIKSLTEKLEEAKLWIKQFRENAAEAGELHFPPIFFKNLDNFLTSLETINEKKG